MSNFQYPNRQERYKTVFEFISREKFKTDKGKHTYMRGAKKIGLDVFQLVSNYGIDYGGDLMSDFEENPTNNVGDMLVLLNKMLVCGENLI